MRHKLLSIADAVVQVRPLGYSGRLSIVYNAAEGAQSGEISVIFGFPPGSGSGAMRT